MSMSAAADFDEDEDRHVSCRPAHTRKFAQFSPEWYQACNQAFARAMRNAEMQESQQTTGVKSFVESVGVLYGSRPEQHAS